MRKKQLKNKHRYVFGCIMCCIVVLIFLHFQFNNRPLKEDVVYLPDYKSFVVPDDILSVSENDVSSSIEIRFSSLQPSQPKTTNGDLVEYGDMVIVKVIGPESKEEEIITTAEEEDEYNIGLQLLGLRKGDTVKVTVENTDISVTIKDIREEIHELNDENVEHFFGYKTMDEFREFVREDIVEHRVFEHCYSELISRSKIQENSQNNSERTQFIGKMLDYYGYSEPLNEDSSATSRSEENNEYSQLLDILNSFFDEFIILRELNRNEGITVDEGEFEKYSNEYLSQGYDKSILRDTLFEYVLFDAYYDHTYELLLKYNLPLERSE